MARIGSWLGAAGSALRRASDGRALLPALYRLASRQRCRSRSGSEQGSVVLCCGAGFFYRFWSWFGGSIRFLSKGEGMRLIV